MPSPIHHLVKHKPTVNAVQISPCRQQLLGYGREHQYPTIAFGKYALGQGHGLWQVLLYCDQELVDALAVAIGPESEQSA